MSRSRVSTGVEAVGLHKRFGAFVALDDVDFSVEPGTVGSLLGPNGAGKTTTIRILTTLLQPDGGRATVAGFDVTTQAHDVRSAIALTGQYTAVDEDLTGSENLVMIGRLSRLPRRHARSRADELLERFGLSAAGGNLVKSYSGGMRRRLDLAASLVVAPSVLFLDEPSTGLDPPSRLELWEVVRGLRQEGTTIVLTTQYLEEADRLADRISLIDRGTIIAEGSVAQLKAEIGGEVLELHSAEPAKALAASALIAERVGLEIGKVTVEPGGREVLVPIPAGSLSAFAAMKLLAAAGIEIDDIALRGSSLDDVFLTLTGHAPTAVNAADPDELEVDR